MKAIDRITINGYEPVDPLKQKYRIVADGYYGDMDESFIFNEVYDYTEEDKLAADIIMLVKLANYNKSIHKGGYLETRDEMMAFLTGLNVNIDECVIPVDSCSYEMLPNCIDKLEIFYYDSEGVKNKVDFSVCFDNENKE